MYIGYSEEQEALRQELRAYYEKLLTDEIREEIQRGKGIGATTRSVVRQMGKDGWLGIGWPKEYGGQGRSAVEQFIFFDESMRALAPVPMLTINTVGPTIMRMGSDEQKKEYLPRILKGEIRFCIGYSEPNAGANLAAPTTRAERDGDEYVINGQKLWTSLAGDACIDTEGIRLTALQAAWRISEGLPAARQVAPSPSTGRPTPVSGSSTSPITCTEAPASTRSTRCTATSSTQSSSSSPSADRHNSCCGSASS